MYIIQLTGTMSKWKKKIKNTQPVLKSFCGWKIKFKLQNIYMDCDALWLLTLQDSYDSLVQSMYYGTQNKSNFGKVFFY